MFILIFASVFYCKKTGVFTITHRQAELLGEPWPLKAGWRHRIVGRIVDQKLLQQVMDCMSSKQRGEERVGRKEYRQRHTPNPVLTQMSCKYCVLVPKGWVCDHCGEENTGMTPNEMARMHQPSKTRSTRYPRTSAAMKPTIVDATSPAKEPPGQGGTTSNPKCP